MAGIYGNNIFDRHFENMLDNYLNSYDSEKEELNDFVKDLENQIDELKECDSLESALNDLEDFIRYYRRSSN